MNDGSKIEINNEKISTGSLYVTNQCVSSDSFSYGSVFAAEMGVTIKTELDRYLLGGAKIEPYYNLKVKDNEFESVPLGVFYVSEPTREGKSISIKAYDRMVDLEEQITENTTGTAFELLEWIALRCGVELAQTEEEILKLTNSKVLLSIESDRIQTYRDVLFYICTVTCTFAVFDRYGKLKLCEFSQEITKEINSNQRESSKISDFNTYFSSAHASFILGGAYKSYITTNEGDGLLYEVGEVPIIQGTDLSNQSVLDNIYSKLTNINYTPCDISFYGDPSIDLGDMIKNTDRYGNETLSLVTFYKWTYRGRHQIKSAGANPKIGEAKNKSDKELENLVADVMLKDITVCSYTNSNAFSFKGGTEGEVKTLKEIVKISFAVNANLTSLISTTICFNLDVQGCVEFGMYLDNVFQEGSNIRQHCLSGPNTVTFINYIPCEKGKTYRVSIFARTYKLNDEDEIPTMSVQKYNIKSVVFGQGIATQVPWDGTIVVEDVLQDLITINNRHVDIIYEFDEGVNAITQVPINGANINIGIKDVSINNNHVFIEKFYDKTADDFTWSQIESMSWGNIMEYRWGKEV